MGVAAEMRRWSKRHVAKPSPPPRRAAGSGCPKKARTFTIKKSRQAVPGYARKRLKPGWVLTVTVRQAGRVTAVRTIKVQRRKPLVASPTRCLPAGAKKPQAC